MEMVLGDVRFVLPSAGWGCCPCWAGQMWVSVTSVYLRRAEEVGGT